MTQTHPTPLIATCQCGKVRFESIGAPILTGACYCASCQEAGHRFGEMLAAPPALDADGGSSYVLFRKDRVRCVAGREFLQEHRLKPESPTRRVVAACCNSAMFVDFTKGHWLSMVRNRFASGAPPVELRMMTKARRAGVEFADEVPNYPGYSGKFMLKLLGAWMAMGFRRPVITWGRPGA